MAYIVNEAITFICNIRQYDALSPTKTSSRVGRDELAIPGRTKPMDRGNTENPQDCCLQSYRVLLRTSPKSAYCWYTDVHACNRKLVQTYNLA